jgi:hypothetical protein
MWALENAAGFTLPLLLMDSTADRLDLSEASKEFTVKAGSKVTLKLWDGGFHEIHNEPEKAEVYKVMLDWLGKYYNLARMRVGLEQPRFLSRRRGCVWTNLPDCGKILELDTVRRYYGQTTRNPRIPSA